MMDSNIVGGTSKVYSYELAHVLPESRGTLTLEESKQKFTELLASVSGDSLTKFLNFVEDTVQEHRGTSWTHSFTQLTVQTDYERTAQQHGVEGV